MKITVEGSPEEIMMLFIREIPYVMKPDVMKPEQNILMTKEEPKKYPGRKRQLELDQIRNIKKMVRDNPKLTNGKIAKVLGLTKSQVHYWRLHTPKEI